MFRLRRMPGSLALLGVFLFSAASAAPPFTRTDLENLLARNPATGKPVDSVAELVPLLPESLRRNFTFVYDSRSPFRASISRQHPRVVLFSPDARLLLTFTGDPAKPGYDLLETISFDDASARFTPKAYELPAFARRGEKVASDNLRCARCHGDDARPIFDSYPLWPGFYGSIRDTFPPESLLGDQEAKDYAAFLSQQRGEGVYAGLLFRGRNSYSPYLNPAKFHGEAIEDDLSDFADLPNTRLGMALTELNRKRIARQLFARPGFARSAPAVLAELLECRQRDPAVLHIARVRSALAAENARRRDRLGVTKKDIASAYSDLQEMKLSFQVAQLDWLAGEEGHSGWSMALEPDSWSLFDGILSGISEGRNFYLKEDFADEILRRLAKDHAELGPYFREDHIYYTDGLPFGHRLDLKRARNACAKLVKR